MKLNYLTNRIKEPKDLCIVFLHGNSLSASFFQTQISSKQFSKYPIFAFDLPGHGKSPKMDNYSIPLILNALINELESLSDFIIVGHSLGGQIAIQLLDEFPERCKGLFIFGTPPLTLDLDLTEVYNINEFSILLLKQDLDENDREELLKFLYPTNNYWKTVIKNSLIQTDPKFRSDYANSLNRQEYLDEVEILKNFNGKKMLVLGSEDPLIKHQYIENVSKQTGIPLNIMDNVGHFPNLDRPEAFNDILMNFLNSIKI